MVVQRLGVHFGDHQRYAVVHAEVITVVDDRDALRHGIPAILLRGTFGALGPGKECEIETLEGIRSGRRYDVKGLARDGLVSLGARQEADFGSRKLPLTKDLHHFGANGTDTDNAYPIVAH